MKKVTPMSPQATVLRYLVHRIDEMAVGLSVEIAVAFVEQ